MARARSETLVGSFLDSVVISHAWADVSLASRSTLREWPYNTCHDPSQVVENLIDLVSPFVPGLRRSHGIPPFLQEQDNVPEIPGQRKVSQSVRPAGKLTWRTRFISMFVYT